MKAIILVASPEECCNLLNGDLSVLARKKFPSDYVGWVYTYCMKGKPYARSYLVRGNGLADYLAKAYDKNYVVKPKKFELYNFEDNGYSAEFYDFYGGKVVARFWCDNVARIINFPNGYETYVSGTFPNIKVMEEEELLKLSCLTREELRNYLPCDKERIGKAIHVAKVKPFDKPKEIKEFSAYCKRGVKCLHCKYYWTDDSAGYSIPMCSKTLTCAPRSGYCYIEI